MSHRERALEKMLKEMVDNHSPITERIHVYLCNVDDEELFEAICKEDRNLNEATEYLYAKGSAIAVKGVADVSNEMEKEWVKEYYLKEKIESKDLMNLPPAKGERIEVEKIVEKETVVYKEPTFEQIANYLAEQKEKKNIKPVEPNEGNLSLFD